MQIKLGETIRALRHRDGRTQEALANALGVSSQAISRWEANGGYPDMETIPSIANYFHVTIDELFGYDGKREEKIKDIIIESDKLLNSKNKENECVSMLKAAIEEFPSEVIIKLKLGYALTVLGFKKYGARRSKPSINSDSVNDIEYNKKNQYFIEALQIYENVINEKITPDERLHAVTNMVRLYSLIGEYTKAEELAKNQNSIKICKECLLSFAVEGDKQRIYQGEAILSLSHELKKVITQLVTTKSDLRSTYSGIEKLQSIANLYASIIDDNNYGEVSFDLCEIYFWCAVLSAEQGDLEAALNYFECSYNFKKEYDDLLNRNKSHVYTSQLVSGVEFENKNVSRLPEWKNWLKAAPSSLQEMINSSEKFVIEN